MLEIVLFTITSFLVGLSGALVPGPMLTVTISDSFKKGFISGPLITSGHIFTELIIVLLLLFGLGWVIGSPTASIIIGILGGIVLIIMGLQIVKETPELEIQPINTSNPSKDLISLKNQSENSFQGKEILKNDETSNLNLSHKNSMFKGVLTSLSNPFFFIWWATIGGTFIIKGMALAGFLGIFAFLIGHWSSDLIWFSTVSFISSKSSALITPRNYKIIMRICGVFMISVGGYFFINSLGIF